MSIGIVGGGASAIAMLRAVLAQNEEANSPEAKLEPVVLERGDSFGGIWNVDSYSWAHMQANSSYLSTGFSDFPYPAPPEDIFPSRPQVHAYLNAYVEHFGLKPYLRFDCTVTHIEPVDTEWEVRWYNTQFPEQTSQQRFKYIVIATGICAQPYTPKIAGLEHFSGRVMHSSTYEDSQAFQDKRVAVVGGSFSGMEIAAAIADTAQQVISIFREPPWILPRWISVDPECAGSKKGPVDLVPFRRAVLTQTPESDSPSLERNRALFKHCHEQCTLSDALFLNPEEDKASRVVVSDGYLPAVQAARIQPLKGTLKCMTGNTLVLNVGEGEEPTVEEERTVEADCLILATGYRPNLDFLSKDVRETLEYEASHPVLPLILHKATWHPDLPGIAFIGLYPGTYFAVLELQARWIAAVFSGRCNLPDRACMAAGIQEARTLRAQQRKQPYPNYVQFADGIAEELGLLPDWNKLQSESPEIHEILWKGPVTPFHYRVFNSSDAQQTKQALEQSYQAWKTAGFAGTTAPPSRPPFPIPAESIARLA